MKLAVLNPAELSTIFIALGLLLLSAFLSGKMFSFIKAPKVIGEIFGGLFLILILAALGGENLIKSLFGAFSEEGKILNIFYHFGLIFLMFMAGFNTRLSFDKSNLKIISSLFIGATFLPIFIGLFFVDSFRGVYEGASGDGVSFTLVFLIAIAVTSIPVISKIFFDLNIIKTRFASVILTTSTLQDLFLWILLNIAINSALNKSSFSENLLTAIITIALFIGIKIAANALLKVRIKIGVADFLTLSFVLLFMAIAVLNLLSINPMYSAFLVGFLIKSLIANHGELRDKTGLIGDFSFSFFIPIYFALIGVGLDLKAFSFWIFAAFCTLSCVVEFAGAYLGLIFLKLPQIAKTNFAITMNARGGPGIVLASTAFYYEIINADFFTALILTTLLSSALAGYWLRFVKYRYGEAVFKDF